MQDLRDDNQYFSKTRKKDLNDAEVEALVAYVVFGFFEKEAAAYEAMVEHQRYLVAKLKAVAGIVMEPPGPVAVPNIGDFEPFCVKAILLDYVEGCNLNEVVHHFPRSSWKHFVDEAVKIAHTVDKLNILNRDVDERNFVISGSPDSALGDNQGKLPKPHMFMIDLAMCRIRRSDESDGEWGRAKFNEDEALFTVTLKQKWKKHQDFELE